MCCEIKIQHCKIQIGTQTCHSSGAITGTDGTCWSPSISCQEPMHPYILQKNVMDPWPAPYQSSNDYQYFTYDQ